MKVHGGALVGPDGKTLPLSTTIEVDGLLFVSGQLALRNGRIEGDVAAQTEQVFDNILAILAQAGLGLENVIKTTVWLTDPADFTTFNTVYATRFFAPYPARSCVISQLVLPNARLEIEVVASRDHRRT